MKYIGAAAIIVLIFVGGFIFAKYQAGQSPQIQSANNYAQPSHPKKPQPAGFSSPPTPQPVVREITGNEKKVRPDSKANYLSRELPPPPHETDPQVTPSGKIAPQQEKQRQQIREKIAESMRRDGLPAQDIERMLDGLEAARQPIDPGFLSTGEMEPLTPEQAAEELRATLQFDGIPAKDIGPMVEGLTNQFKMMKEGSNAEPEHVPPPPPTPAPSAQEGK